VSVVVPVPVAVSVPVPVWVHMAVCGVDVGTCFVWTKYTPHIEADSRMKASHECRQGNNGIGGLTANDKTTTDW